MKISRYCLDTNAVPVDFFADPDGDWQFEDLVEAAGFDPERPGVCVGALVAPFEGHPEGAAVVMEMGARKPYVAVVECPPARSGGTRVSPSLASPRAA